MINPKIFSVLKVRLFRKSGLIQNATLDANLAAFCSEQKQLHFVPVEKASLVLTLLHDIDKKCKVEEQANTMRRRGRYNTNCRWQEGISFSLTSSCTLCALIAWQYHVLKDFCLLKLFSAMTIKEACLHHGSLVTWRSSVGHILLSSLDAQLSVSGLGARRRLMVCEYGFEILLLQL